MEAATKYRSLERQTDLLQPNMFWENKEIPLTSLPSFNLDVVTTIFNRAVSTYELYYKNLDKNIHYKSIQAINMFKEGVAMEVHSDRGPVKENNNILHGFVVYLNDDYEGGQIYYPKKNIIIKPKRCSLVIHPGTEEYSHGVKTVELGTRYALTMFSKESRT